MSHSKKDWNDICTNFNIDPKAIKNQLKINDRVFFDFNTQNWVTQSSIANVVSEMKYDAVKNRLGDMEFALDEKGRPDGLKNKQEMLLTIASDIAESASELVYEEAKNALLNNDWLDTEAMRLLKEGKE